MKYKVGDVVKVKEKEDLRKASRIRDVYVSSEMLEYAGRLATICKVDTDNCVYFIEEDDKTHIWISEFFEDEENGEDDNCCVDKILEEGERESDEYIINKVLSEMTEETKNIIIKEMIKGENCISIVAVPVYETVCRRNGISIQRIVGTKYSVTVIGKDGTVVL